jgi:ubiquinone/menaquinone biosynthesis C-methylase UbiE
MAGNIMWVWILTGLFFIVLVVLVTGGRRLNTTRHIGPEEGIEDIEVARGYDKISQWPQFRMLRRLIISELRSYHPQGTLVDIGCGPGYLIADILRAFPQLSVIGVDIAEEMLQRAADNLSALGFGERSSFRQGDIHELPFGNGSVDFVVSTLSLHHWSEPTKAVSEVHRVLKPGSRFLLFDLRRDSPRLFYWAMRFAQKFVLPAAMSSINEPTSSVLASYTSAELRQILSGTPFKDWSLKQGIFWSFVAGKKTA